MKKLTNALFDIGAIKFGSFTLKSGIVSPVYIDLRVIVSYPTVLQTVAEAMWQTIRECSFDLVCGVPYTALPIATAISLAHDIPMVMRRKEVKDYGTKKIIEGVFQKGQTALVIEDLVTSGSSVFETIDPLLHEGLVVKDVVVLLDREQGGRKHIEEKGYTLHSVMTMTQLLADLEGEKKITEDTAQMVRTFVQSHQT